MKYKFRIYTAILASLVLVLPVACKIKKDDSDSSTGDSGKTKKWNRSEAASEYELLQAELRLASSIKPYLVLDFRNKKILIKLKGTIVWNCPMNIIDGNDGDLKDFSERFRGDSQKLIRPLLEKYLYKSSEKTPDSILAIVAPAVNVDPKLLQREVPERFTLFWGRNLVFDIRTNVEGKPTSKFRNTMLDLRRVIRSPFGEAYVEIKMEPEQALTLFYVGLPGLPTLIYPAP